MRIEPKYREKITGKKLILILFYFTFEEKFYMRFEFIYVLSEC